jgi:hypothetical protein
MEENLTFRGRRPAAGRRRISGEIAKMLVGKPSTTFPEPAKREEISRA